MVTNTVQTLLDYAKDITGKTNASNEKLIRFLNFGLDHLSSIKLMIGAKRNPDSSNNTDTTRVTVTSSDTSLTLSGGALDVGEALTFRHLERNTTDGYIRLTPVDSRDEGYVTLQNQTGTPTHFDIDGNIIRLYPVPTGEFTYRFTYGRVHPRYTADNLTQHTGLLPNEEEYVALYAADKLMIGSNDPIRAQIRNDLAVKENEIKQMTVLSDQTGQKRLRPKLISTFTSRFNTR